MNTILLGVRLKLLEKPFVADPGQAIEVSIRFTTGNIRRQKNQSRKDPISKRIELNPDNRVVGNSALLS